MKATKILLLSALIFGLFALTVACGGENAATDGQDDTNAPETAEETFETPDETNAPETEAPETEEPKKTVDLSEKYFNYAEFELPTGDLRQYTVDYMLKQSQVEWKCTKTFTIDQDVSSQGYSFKFTYNKGTVYTGLPYANSYAMIPEFERYINENREYKAEKSTISWYDVPGVQCNTAIMAAIQRFSKITGTSLSLSPIDPEFQELIVGEYSTDYASTAEAVKGNGTKTMYAAYSLLQKGDIIYRGPMSPHLRLVVENHVEKKSDGSVNPRKSYIITVEQTSSIDETRKDGVTTTWWVNHKYTYEDLFTTTYLPVTVKEYETPNEEKFYVGLTKEITAGDLADEFIAGSVETNSVLRYVYFEIFDQSGKVVSSYARHNMHDYDTNTLGASSQKVDLRTAAATLFKDLPAGEYTFKLTVGIPIGEAVLAEVGFTYSK